MTDQELLDFAYKANEKAYAPYSRFQVGAAIVTKEGKVFTGCNVENSSYGAAICAERTAAVKAVSEGYHDFEMIAIASNGSDKETVYPCGICRQFLHEFNPDLKVICQSPDGFEIDETNGNFNRTDSSWKNRTVDPISKDLRCRDHFRRFYAGL